MASPKMIIQIALGKKESSKEGDSAAHEAGETAINELVERVLCTRNAVQLAHWSTNSYASHVALGDLYEGIVDQVDDIVETYQGTYGLLKNLEVDACCLDKDISLYIQDDADWVKSHRSEIANGSSVIENLVDNLSGLYSKTLYKLKNLK